MSQFLPDDYRDQRSGQSTRTPEQGPEAYLSPEERKFWQRFTSFPEELSPKFRSWVIDLIAVNGQLSISQVAGFSRFTATPSIIATNEATTSTSFVDLTTVGPSITGLGSGKYLFLVGCQVSKTAVADAGIIGIKYNSDATIGVLQAEVGSQAFNFTVSGAVTKDFADANNSVKLQYRTNAGNSVNFLNRSLIALRYGN